MQKTIEDTPDPDPLSAGPRRVLVYVPVRTSAQAQSLVFARLGEQRVLPVFSTPALLRSAMGADQPWTCLAETALRALLRPLGPVPLRMDPQIVAMVPTGARPDLAPRPRCLPERRPVARGHRR